MHRFDPRTMTWFDLSPAAAAGGGGGGAAAGGGGGGAAWPGVRDSYGITAWAGRIYIFGGWNSHAYLNDLQEYDTARGTWTALWADGEEGPGRGDPPPERRYGVAMAAARGAVFVCAGYGYNGYYHDLYKFDLAAAQWTDLTAVAKGKGPDNRYYVRLVASSDTLYVFGGYGEVVDNMLNDLYSFGLDSLEWTDLSEPARGPVPEPRYLHSVAYVQGAIFVFGGWGQKGFLSDLWMYDIAKFEWYDLRGVVRGVSPYPRSHMGFTSSAGSVYVFGGWDGSGVLNDLHRFETAAAKWTDLTDEVSGAAPAPRSGHGFAELGQSLFVFGGYGEAGYLNDLHRFNVSTSEWAVVTGELSSSPPSPRFHLGFATAEEKLFVFGGFSESGFLNDLHIFDLEREEWSYQEIQPGFDSPKPRYNHGFTSTSGKIFVFGGMDASGVLDDLWCFSLATNEWADLTLDEHPTWPLARAGHGLTAIDGKLYTFGGFGGYWGAVSYLNDLFQFDPSSRLWVDLTAQIDEAFPSPRFQHGFVAAMGMLFVFGGTNSAGFPLSDLYCVTAPEIQVWHAQAGVDFFINVYDWDVLNLDTLDETGIIFELKLCSGVFPCSLSIDGDAGGSLRKHRNGSISCFASAGCQRVLFNAVPLACDGELSSTSVLSIQGAKLSVKNSSFSDCFSESDGGIINAYGSAAVTIKGSRFQNITAGGMGGAIIAAGGTLHIETSMFLNCTAGAGGGAVYIAEYLCSGSIYTLSTITLCVFENCRSYSSGGAVLVTGQLAYSELRSSTFTHCTSGSTGGAISVNNLAHLTITDSSFMKNKAEGLGGGALHVDNANAILQGLDCTRNEAMAGGGGVLLWSGSMRPIIRLWCGAGSMSIHDSCTPSECTPNCSLCVAGTYQTGDMMTSCSSCAPGMYSTTVGATSSSTCVFCAAGSYSSIEGAIDSSACIVCEAGTFSPLGGSMCSLCEAGKYSSIAGATSLNDCIGCRPGTHSTVIGAIREVDCIACQGGEYSQSGATECLACPSGKYGSAVPATSISSCIECPVGYYSFDTAATSASVCTPCRPGSFSGLRFFSYEPTPLSWIEASSACASAGGALAVIQSMEDNQQVLDSMPHGQDFWIGFHMNASDGRWIWSDSSVSAFSNWGFANPKNISDLFGCTVFPSYAYPTQNSSVMGEWPYYQENYGVNIDANTFSTSPPGSWYNYDCSNSNQWVKGYVCSFVGATTCMVCEAGKYSTTSGASSLDSCLPCSVGKFTNGTGATACAACGDPTATDASEGTWCNSESARQKFSESSKVNIRIDNFESNHSDITNDKRRSLRAKTPLRSRQHNRQSHHAGLHRISRQRQASLPFDATMGVRKFVAKESRILASDFKSKRSICGQLNSAGYGPCLASSYATLTVVGLPSDRFPAFAGLTFSFVVTKKDSYGQTIIIDSLSLLQAESSSGNTLQADTSNPISGTSVVNLLNGKASFSISLKPTFSAVVPERGQAVLTNNAYVYLKGADLMSETIQTMQSKIFEIIISNGSSVCPLGFVLILDRSKLSSYVGSCSKCGAGSYSVSPLAGSTPLEPSCLNCPVGGICAGGNEVQFNIGTWIIADGLYKLVGCPRGYMLLNSINGVFSHDLQQCLRCQPNEYILDSNSSSFTCQSCPQGAICDGSVLKGLVAGSIWEADWSTGQYSLKSCPPGYQRFGTTALSQECKLCLATYYCIGGSASAAACPEGTFSTAGSNSSSACTAAVFVSISISLPMTSAEFTKEKEQKFQEALAAAAGVESGRILLLRIAEARRKPKTDVQVHVISLHHGNTTSLYALTEDELDSVRGTISEFQQAVQNLRGVGAPKVFSLESIENILLPHELLRLRCDQRRASLKRIDIYSKVVTSDKSAADVVIGKLSADSLNDKLSAVGLPQGTISTINVDNVDPLPTGLPLAIIIGASIGGFVFFWLVLAAGYHSWRKLQVQAAHQAFLAAFRNAKTGDKASLHHLPYQLRNLYEAQDVLGRGAFGCVLSAKSKQNNRLVAVKVIVPDKGIFHDKDLRQLKREAVVLQLFTSHKCEHAVQLTEVESVRIEPRVCWFVTELLQGENMETIIKNGTEGPISDLECIKAGRNVLAALKLMHDEGMVHRDIKPANIMRCRDESPGKEWDGQSYTYKLLDFGTALGIDESIAKEAMMTLSSSRQMGAGTLPYMSPEMFKEPERASYPTDLWSLGVTLFELASGCLPFEAESDLLTSIVVAGDLDEKAPNVLSKLSNDRRSTFDTNLAKVIARALEKRVDDRFRSVDEMHDALYRCLIERREACYSIFVSYRQASEIPFARLLFDDLNHSVTPGGHRVTVCSEAQSSADNSSALENSARGLLNSLCFFPLLSYGSTAPLAEFPEGRRADLLAEGWEDRPCDLQRLHGSYADREDEVLKEFLIAAALLDQQKALRSKDLDSGSDGQSLLQLAYPILIGRQEPRGHPDYPRMGNFFRVQGGGGTYPQRPTPPTNEAAAQFLKDKACMPAQVVQKVLEKSVLATVQYMTSLQGCQMWDHPPDLKPADLTKEQTHLVGKGCTGPAVKLDGIELTAEQRELCQHGFDEEQLRMLKAEIRHKRGFFHEIIDRAITAQAEAEQLAMANQAVKGTTSLRTAAHVVRAAFTGRRVSASGVPRRLTRNSIEVVPALKAGVDKSAEEAANAKNKTAADDGGTLEMAGELTADAAANITSIVANQPEVEVGDRLHKLADLMADEQPSQV